MVSVQEDTQIRFTMKEKVKSIHMIAVCGTGMGALARMLKDQGFEITGSDHKNFRWF